MTRRSRSGSADSLETHDPRDREGQEYRGPKYDEYGRRLFVRFKRRHRKMLLDFLADGPPLPRYMRLRSIAPRLEPDPALFKAIEKMYRRRIGFCKCCACRDLRPRREQPYTCKYQYCYTAFDDFATYLEHQLSAHGVLEPTCRRIDQVVYRQEHGTAARPPLTIYMAHQALEPMYRPIEWSMQRANDEYEAMQKRLTGPSMIKLRTNLMAAYEDIQRGGPARLYRHYRLALEHYESTLKYSIGPRSSHVTTADIAPGRNWFVRITSSCA
ncbi:hypothetical protein PINS_up000362 [Pythium insidiosum]|nr:hypothetical protein PINS_up000362 [Pythium insidiosum]